MARWRLLALYHTAQTTAELTATWDAMDARHGIIAT